jgi:hypothetical protein
MSTLGGVGQITSDWSMNRSCIFDIQYQFQILMNNDNSLKDNVMYGSKIHLG